MTTTVETTCHTCRTKPARYLGRRKAGDTYLSCEPCRLAARNYGLTTEFTPLPATLNSPHALAPVAPPSSDGPPQLALEAPGPKPLRPASSPAPGTARRSDPPESHKAAGRVVTRGSHRWKVLAAFAAAQDNDPPGLTSEEACDAAGLSPRSSPWKRVSELRQWGWIAPTGESRVTLSGADAAVLALTVDGLTSWRKAQA